MTSRNPGQLRSVDGPLLWVNRRPEEKFRLQGWCGDIAAVSKVLLDSGRPRSSTELLVWRGAFELLRHLWDRSTHATTDLIRVWD
jgi:hypothetical protein